MANHRVNGLPRFLVFHKPNQTYYYKNPDMPRKANLGKGREEATRIAKALNHRSSIEAERRADRIEAALSFGSRPFGSAFDRFVQQYAEGYRLKASTRQRLIQRSHRLRARIGDVQLPAVTTQILREAIADDSAFEQTKQRTLLKRFFQLAKSQGDYPQHLPNPVDDLFVDPSPGKLRQRMTLSQFHAILVEAPDWLRTMMVLGLHLALRQVDLVSLRFQDVQADRIVSAVRKTDSDARGFEATSVSFPIHPDVRRAIAKARESSIVAGRCPYIIHRLPNRRTRRLTDALAAGRTTHPAQVQPEYASKAFARAREQAMANTSRFKNLRPEQLPTFHEIRALASHLYARAGFETESVQNLMAHTDPDLTRAYQRGHSRKVLVVDMMLPVNTLVEVEDTMGVRETRLAHSRATRETSRSHSRLTPNAKAMQLFDLRGVLERETRLELATPTLARSCSTN
jgi:enterobacteria phage integrase